MPTDIPERNNQAPDPKAPDPSPYNLGALQPILTFMFWFLLITFIFSMFAKKDTQVSDTTTYTPKYYRVIYSNSAVELGRLVDSMKEQGWKVSGGVAISDNNLAQAMERDKIQGEQK